MEGVARPGESRRGVKEDGIKFVVEETFPGLDSEVAASVEAGGDGGMREEAS